MGTLIVLLMESVLISFFIYLFINFFYFRIFILFLFYYFTLGCMHQRWSKPDRGST